MPRKINRFCHNHLNFLAFFFPPLQNVLEQEIVVCLMTQKCQPVHAMPVILVASLGYDDLGWAMKKSLSFLVY